MSGSEKRFLVIRDTEGGAEEAFCGDGTAELREAMFYRGFLPEDEDVIKHVQQMPVGEYAQHRLGWVIRLRDEESEATKKRDPMPLKQETFDRLRETVATLTVQQAARLEEMLGAELIVRAGENGAVEVSRLSLANAFINDAEIGLRIALEVETDKGPVTGVRFMSFADDYNPQGFDRARLLHELDPLKKILALLED